MEKLDVIQYSIIGIVMGGLILVMVCGAYLYCCNQKVVNNTVNVDNEEKVNRETKRRNYVYWKIKI